MPTCTCSCRRADVNFSPDQNGPVTAWNYDQFGSNLKMAISRTTSIRHHRDHWFNVVKKIRDRKHHFQPPCKRSINFFRTIYFVSSSPFSIQNPRRNKLSHSTNTNKTFYNNSFPSRTPLLTFSSGFKMNH